MVAATVEGNVEAVRELVECGSDIDGCNERGETAFSFACAYNQLAVAQLLYWFGADINTVDVGGGSPFDWAVCHASPSFCEWLVGVGGERHDNSYEPWNLPPRPTN